jgi:hypothetical protein
MPCTLAHRILCSIEVHLMQTPIREDFSSSSAMDFPTVSGGAAPGLADYLRKSTQRLVAISDGVGRGEKVDRATHDWMLSSVDFLVESMGDESLELGDELRSNLLQLLLAIANLNERIRQLGSLSA